MAGIRQLQHDHRARGHQQPSVLGWRAHRVLIVGAGAGTARQAACRHTIALAAYGRRADARGLAALVLSAALVQLPGCTSAPALPERALTADRVASAGGLSPRRVEGGRWPLRAYVRPAAEGHSGPLRVYIEGDGLAWETETRPGEDPTPANPLGLRLAVADTLPGPVIYLARPCQFVGASGPDCDVSWWTQARYSAPVVQALDEAIDRLVPDTQARSLWLIGYSGGGTLATLLAARRSDVALLVTVAAPLAVRSWARMKGYSPLEGSLDPMDVVEQLRVVQQVHLVGARDVSVPPGATIEFARKLGASGLGVVRTIEEFDHVCCWAQRWPSIVSRLPAP